MLTSGTLAGSEEFLERLQSARSLEDLQARTEELQPLLGVDHVVYHWVNSKGERYGAGTYSQEWVDRYLEKDYLRMDPVIYGCFQRFAPVNWKHLDWSGRAAREFFREAVEYGVGNQGYTIPTRGPNGQFALFTVSHSCADQEWEDFLKHHARALMIVAHEFNQRAMLSELGEGGMVTPVLSPRELSAITCLAKGLSRAQAAAELNISEHTLRVYIEAARHKLGALNTTHAVARALSSGIIVV